MLKDGIKKKNIEKKFKATCVNLTSQRLWITREEGNKTKKKDSKPNRLMSNNEIKKKTKVTLG